MEQKKIEIMDTTLRDGEQTSGVSFSAAEKLTIAQLLLEELQPKKETFYEADTEAESESDKDEKTTN